MDVSHKLIIGTTAGVVAGALVWFYWRRENRAVCELDAVGGHGSKKNKGPPIMMRGNLILKPFQPAAQGKSKSRGELEADFYAEVSGDPGHPLVRFLPRYHGVVSEGGTTYLALENETLWCSKACVLDLKMGTQTYDEDASPKKIAREKSKYPPQETIGFRFVGMKVYHPNAEAWDKSDRAWCMSLKPNDIPAALGRFLSDGQRMRTELVQPLLAQLEEILECRQQHAKWRMYGSSLLLVYDGSSNAAKIAVKMIDFAHVFPIKDCGRDAGYIHGLKFLMDALRALKISSAFAAAPAQVGGAHNNIGFSSGGTITKLEDKPDQFDTEALFYEEAARNNDAFYAVMPSLIEVRWEDEPKRALVLEDACALVRSDARDVVSVLDVKMGLRSFRAQAPNDPKASYFEKYDEASGSLEPERNREIWNEVVRAAGAESGTKTEEYPPKSIQEGKLGKQSYLRWRDAATTSARYAFRLTAMSHGGEYATVTQSESRRIATWDEFCTMLRLFCSDPGSGKLDHALVEAFDKELINVLNSINNSDMCKRYEFVGSSLLFLHSGGRIAVKWIDFANCSVAQRVVGDSNGIVDGVSNLRKALQSLLS